MRCPTLSELPVPPRGKKGWPWTEESPQLADAMPDVQPWPKISVVTPSYNQGEFIEMTIRSVLLQGYPDSEYIVIDGGSTDSSVEIIKKYEKWLTNWVSEPDRGQSHAINKGFEKATGSIYTWLNSDDYLLKDALNNVAMAHLALPTAGGWFGGGLFVKEDKDMGQVYWPNRLDVEGLANWSENGVVQPACFFSEKAWHKCGPLEEDLQYGMDFDLWLKIAKGFHIEKVNKVLAAAHIHGDAKTQRDIAKMYAVQYLIQIRHGYERFAVRDISRWINDYIELGGKYSKLTRIPRWISRFPLFRPIMPFARIIWKRLL